MKTTAITASLVVLALVALWTPRQDTASTAPADEPAPSAAAGSPRAGQAADTIDSGAETRLTRDADGHFYAAVAIDGRAVEMLVDTGASFIALTPDDADRANVDWHESDAVVVGSGASGPVRGVPVTLDEVELGDHRARGVRAAVIVDGLQVSLLGQSFLGQIATVRIEGDRMVLGDG